MKKAMCLAVALVLLSFAHADTLKSGGFKIEYDTVIEDDSDFDGTNDRKSYYLNDELVFAEYDNDMDGEADMWFTYTEGVQLDTASRDTSDDGKPNDFVTYDEEGNIVSEKSRMTFSDTTILLFFAGVALVVVAVVLLFRRKKHEKHSKKHRKKAEQHHKKKHKKQA